ncbi:MAG: hypothetical protein U0935_19465 [Pirellulales bacterium]
MEVRGRHRRPHRRAVNSQTFENLTPSGQTRFGFDNEGQAISIRQLKSEARRSGGARTYGVPRRFVEADLAGHDGEQEMPAVINYNGGQIGLRHVATSGSYGGGGRRRRSTSLWRWRSASAGGIQARQ